MRTLYRLLCVLLFSLSLLHGRAVQATELLADLHARDAEWVARVAPSPSHSPGAGPLLNMTIAGDLNYSQYDYTLINSIMAVNPHLCLNYALTLAAADLVDMATLCTVAEVNANNCSQLTPNATTDTLRRVGWTSPSVTGVAIATHLPGRYFNWTSELGEAGTGLYGYKAYEAGLLAVPKLEAKLNSTLKAGRYNLAASYTVALLSDDVYSYVLLGESPDQHCYGE
ncbi:hypothetical protein CDCA_CDCA04G1188 [Cyanidium caldarium]|uniref:Uncharacterized protein n=1 Tax=Cyanidium caldarium TaxID=2771 RepID=A0AAV9ISV2_CYACA|nr:hypothetical protein CDCA_CDCA04G1188 [Cyanidium caldarium]